MSRFKTELCNNLIELGNCKYGDRCHYAHGAHELRQVSKRHPKYRTEKCKNFELTGKCPFGPRCSYVHPKPDLDSMIDQLTKYMKHTKAPKPDIEDDENTPITHVAAISRPSSSSIVKTPLGNSNSSNTNILTATSLSTATTTTISSNNYQNNILNHQNFIHVNSSTNNSSTTATTKAAPISGNLNDGTCSDNLSIFDQTSFESNKKLRLISQNSSNYNISTASNPFGIYSPLSDMISKTNVNTRSPLQPNKQFYTRF